ncbi:hypothetical protein LCGC14_0223290 [marine sediment metagenome]|uniref:Uncharacterized protein n=1 Tax=marine sediment metagenome TaxID=412755 RepID=A0A0F9WWF7_9ZZZZ|nr:hypothetical protein [bacterium]
MRNRRGGMVGLEVYKLALDLNADGTWRVEVYDNDMEENIDPTVITPVNMVSIGNSISTDIYQNGGIVMEMDNDIVCVVQELVKDKQILCNNKKEFPSDVGFPVTVGDWFGKTD